MIIKEGECILCDSHESYVELIGLLLHEGYRLWNEQALSDYPHRAGVRWTPGDGPFPNCFCYTPEEVRDELLTYGKIKKHTFTDAGINYHVSLFAGDEQTMRANQDLTYVEDLI